MGRASYEYCVTGNDRIGRSVFLKNLTTKETFKWYGEQEGIKILPSDVKNWIIRNKF